MPKLKNKKFLLIIFVVFSLGLVSISLALIKNETPSTQNTQNDASARCEGLELAEKCFKLELADTNQARIKGLSDRDGLPENSGMLFIFEEPEEQCFWMKDMLFSIDIIWANEAKQVIKVEENVSPGTYPNNFCAGDTKYVLEFDAGFAEEYGLKTGTRLQF